MAQLPYLMYDQQPSMSSKAFKELALSLLNKEDRANIELLSLGYNTEQKEDALEDDKEKKQPKKSVKKKSGTGNAFIDSWCQWEKTMRLNLARYRSLKLYKDITDTAEPPVEPADAFEASADVFTYEGTPLEKEIYLDKVRWNAIEMLTGSDFFHSNNVYAYYLKLLILERRQLFDADVGFAEYKSLYSQIVDSSHRSHTVRGSS